MNIVLDNRPEIKRRMARPRAPCVLCAQDSGTRQKRQKSRAKGAALAYKRTGLIL
jgi:hypothetical protein